MRDKVLRFEARFVDSTKGSGLVKWFEVNKKRKLVLRVLVLFLAVLMFMPGSIPLLLFVLAQLL